MRVAAWEDDPGDPKVQPPRVPIDVALPDPSRPPLPFRIKGAAPPASTHQPGTREFLYYALATSLRRTADFWGQIVPQGTSWAVGKALPVEVDGDRDLNAFYSRGGGGYQPGLTFCHDSFAGRVIYSGESPDIASHEMGHAVLDAIRPELWSALSVEVAAFHESFGDMSSILSVLQVPSFAEAVLRETGGSLNRASRLSRVAEQLGAALRAARPDSVDPDSLRNASNSFFYRDPQTLPPSAPASALSSQPHSFSRVFTGGFLDALAGMFRASRPANAATLAQVALDMGRLLVTAITTAPVVPDYFSQIAAQMVEACEDPPFKGRYRDALKSAFVRRGLLSLQAAVSLNGGSRKRRAVARGMSGIAAEAVPVAWLPLPAAHLGLKAKNLLVQVATGPRELTATASSPSLTPLEPKSPQSAAQAYAEELFQRGHVDVGRYVDRDLGFHNAFAFKSHTIEERDGTLVLVRSTFNCGICACV